MEYKFDIQSLATKLSFLIGKVVMFKDSIDSVCSVMVNAIRVERTMDGSGANVVLDYSNGTEQRIKSIDKFNELILVDKNSYASTVKSILDNMGVIEF